MNKSIINLFTHTDLDGVGCSVLTHLYARGRYDSVEVRYCDYSNINERIKNLIDLLSMPLSVDVRSSVRRLILITDISVNEQIAKELDDLQKKHVNIDVAMIDHHQLSETIRSYPWAHVNTDPTECGTSLLRRYLSGKDILETDPWDPIDYLSTQMFVNDVCLYDTWRFDKTKETNSENLNTLLGLLGQQEFEMKLTSWLFAKPGEPYSVADSDDYMFVRHEQENRQEYCSLRNRHLIKTQYKGYTAGIVFSDRYTSTLGDYVLTNNPDIDFCAIVNLPVSVSLRTKRDDINLGLDIAKPLGGGGHPKAAAFSLGTLPSELVKELIKFT